MDEDAIESTKKRKRNGHHAIAHESYRRTREVVASTPESRMSLPGYDDSALERSPIKLHSLRF